MFNTLRRQKVDFDVGNWIAEKDTHTYEIGKKKFCP